VANSLGDTLKSINIIAIDGPAASGKTTLGRKLAKKINYLFFDTGVMYRALTWLAINRGVSLDDDKAITHLAELTSIDVKAPSINDGRIYDVLVDSEDVTWKIKENQVDQNVSKVSAYPGVRKALSQQQRRIGLRGNVVMVGRDIGTVVLPEADIKFYLDASVEERAKRRFREYEEREKNLSYATVLQAMIERDRIDSTRDIAPLRPAEDAILINSDHMSIEQVLEQILQLIEFYRTTPS